MRISIDDEIVFSHDTDNNLLPYISFRIRKTSVDLYTELYPLGLEPNTPDSVAGRWKRYIDTCSYVVLIPNVKAFQIDGAARQLRPHVRMN